MWPFASENPTAQRGQQDTEQTQDKAGVGTTEHFTFTFTPCVANSTLS